MTTKGNTPRPFSQTTNQNNTINQNHRRQHGEKGHDKKTEQENEWKFYF
jgi:hypothetical protein